MVGPAAQPEQGPDSAVGELTAQWMLLHHRPQKPAVSCFKSARVCTEPATAKGSHNKTVSFSSLEVLRNFLDILL